MLRILAGHGWLEVVPDPAGGNRNHLKLTGAGEELVATWGVELETRLADLLKTAGIPYRTYLSHTDQLLDALDPPPGAAVGMRPALGSGRRRA